MEHREEVKMNYLQYPNPIFARENITLLDGQWNIDIISEDNERVNCVIQVPFCPESALSGVRYTKRIETCTYNRQFTLEQDRLDGKRIMLHFGAVDYNAQVYINDRLVDCHTGGYTPFSMDITDYVRIGNNNLFVRVHDYTRNNQAHGKQTHRDYSFGCFYTRTTGIWQSVWLEYVPQNHIHSFRFFPDPKRSSVDVELRTTGSGTYKVEVFFEGQIVGCSLGTVDYRTQTTIALTQKHLWQVGNGALYDVKITYDQDEVYTYFGLRSVGFKGYDFLLNGKPVFQKLVLDQGFYPDGLYTAPSIEAMEKDIRLGLELGFNGARLHEKVFDPRFLYLCDRMGYMVWGEFPSWGVDYFDLSHFGQFVTEWEEELARDFNHPSIVAWCPLNEVWGDWDTEKRYRDVRFVEGIYDFTKLYDPTRPCVDTSGGHHGKKTDIYDFHCYCTADFLAQRLKEIEQEGKMDIPFLYCAYDDLRYKKGTPVMVSEFGGFSLGIKPKCENKSIDEGAGAVLDTEAWGYGDGEENGTDFANRYAELVQVISSSPMISGFCYTQLYDIEQEANGFYTYDRKDKLTEEEKSIIRRANDAISR